MIGPLAALLLVKATLVAGTALAVVRCARGSPAAVRHVLLAAAFAVLLLLPLASVVAPPVQVPLRLATPPMGAATAVEPIARMIGAESTSDEATILPPVPRSFLPSTSAVLLASWFAGVIVFLLPLIAGLRQTQSLRRSAIPWREGQAIADRLGGECGLRNRVEVLRHEALPGPMTCGVLRPAILLPIDALSWTAADRYRALVHELAHVRRCDWLTRSIARAVAACYWFHPLVWMAWRELSLEAERACDDAVVRAAEPTAYADQLVALAQRMRHGGTCSLLAMASRRDLPTRIRALLDSRQRRGPAGAAFVALVGAVALALVASISPLRIVAVQPADAGGQTFEVASVKTCKEPPATGNQRRLEFRTDSPDRVTIQCLTLERIIFFAYAGVGNMNNPLRNAVPNDQSRVRGGPGWVRSDLFTIEATAEGAPGRFVMMGPMLRALLEDRFQLRVHRETEDAPMYALTVAKSGLKIKPIDDSGCTSPDFVRDLSAEARQAINSSKPVCGSFTSLGDGVNRTWVLGGTSLQTLANNRLSGVLDRFVLDQTGVAGLFNIRLTFGLDDSIRKGVFGGAGVGTPPEGLERGPSIFTALEEQLGLKLERTRDQSDFIVIDRVQRPMPD